MKIYEKWFQKAENDLLTIKNNLAAEITPVDTCCFHAQQVAEKYLKAFLVSRNVGFPKTHDLEVLLNLLIEKNKIFSELLSNIDPLQDYSIASRYPDEIDELTIDDAKTAYQNALTIKEFILKNFLA